MHFSNCETIEAISSACDLKSPDFTGQYKMKCDKKLDIQGAITAFEGYRFTDYYYATGFKLTTDLGEVIPFGYISVDMIS